MICFLQIFDIKKKKNIEKDKTLLHKYILIHPLQNNWKG